MADVLGADDGSSCCQRLEDLDDEHIDGIRQRNGGDGGTADAGYHHCICHTHEGCKQLLNDQRDQKLPEIRGGKLQMVPVDLVSIIDFSSQHVVLYFHKIYYPDILSSPVTELWYHEIKILHPLIITVLAAFIYPVIAAPRNGCRICCVSRKYQNPAVSAACTPGRQLSLFS